MFSIFNVKKISKSVKNVQLVNEQNDDEFSDELNVNVACASTNTIVKDNFPIKNDNSKIDAECDLGNINTGPLQPILNVSTILQCYH